MASRCLCGLYSLDPQAICARPVRSTVGRAPHALVETLAITDVLNEGDKLTFVLEDERKGRGKQAREIQES